MKRILLATLLGATTLTAAIPALAQPYGPPPPRDRGWDAGRFWNGAPAGPYERIGWLRERIHHGVDDGSLNRREAGRAIEDLRAIEAQARYLTDRDHGRLNGPDRAYLQDRLDRLSRSLRFAEHDGADRPERRDRY